MKRSEIGIPESQRFRYNAWNSTTDPPRYLAVVRDVAPHKKILAAS